MQIAKKYVEKHDLDKTISFKGTGEHIVKLIGGVEDTIKNQDGGETSGIRFTVMEDGKEKTFFTGSEILIKELANIKEGSWVKIELCAKKTPSGVRSFFAVEETDAPVFTKESKIINEDTGEVEGEEGVPEQEEML